MEYIPQLFPHAAADLQRRALASGTAAAQVGQHRGNKDDRHQQHRHILAKVHRFNDSVGILALYLGHAVQPHNNKPQHRQQVQDPRMRCPHLGGIVDTNVEQRSNHPADPSDQRPHRQPLGQRSRVCPYVRRDLFPFFHGIPPFSPCSLSTKSPYL